MSLESDKNLHRMRAGALRFRPDEEGAPRLLARGKGALAAEIIETARRSGVPVMSDPALAESLAELPVGKEVPENLYRALAGVFALVYRLNSNNRL